MPTQGIDEQQANETAKERKKPFGKGKESKTSRQ
jgi:hypothetical protein